MTQVPDDAVRDEMDVRVAPGYPAEAEPDKAEGVPAAEVPGEQTDPARRLTGGDQPEADPPMV